SIPMAWGAVANELTLTTWLLFGANVLWTIAYDTYYAMVDRDDDLRIGVKSTAILFGRYDLRIIALLQMATLALLVWVGWLQQLAWPFYAGLLGAALLFVQQRRSAGRRQREACFQAFLANNRVGGVIFVGILLAMALA
ncbi:MAG: UbiA family prenyltransferase, partial [Aeromonadaceae bacterium]